MKRTFFICLTFALALLALEFLGKRGAWNTELFPAPSEIFDFLGRALTDGHTHAAPLSDTATESAALHAVKSVTDSTLLAAITVTLKRLAFGYFIGFVLGIPLGLITARFRFMRETLGLVALGMQGLPSVCWVPLALIWFGASESAILFVVVMGTIWSLMLATEHGVRTVPPLYSRAARTMGSKGLHLWTHVLIPASLPSVISGMKQGWAFAWRSLMAAEIYVTILSGYGLGWLLHNGRETLDMAQVIGVMLVIVTIGLLADRIIFAPAENWLRARWGLDKA